MNDLRQMLQDKRDWLASTTGAKKAPASLTLPDLDRIISALQQCENPALPKIEPRMLGQQEPRGTRRSPDEVRRLLDEIYNGNQQYVREGLAYLRVD